MKRNVIIHQQIVPEYRIPIFNKVLEKFDNCTIIYGQPPRNSSLNNGKIPGNLNYRKVKNLYLSKTRNTFITRLFYLVFKLKPKVIITQYSPANLDIFLFYILRPFLNFKLIGWYHGWDRERKFSTNKTFYDRLRHYMLKRADAIILYSEDAKAILSAYKSPEKIFVANNSLDTTTYNKLRIEFEKTGRNTLKSQINFKSKYNLIFVSRLEAKKNPYDLIRIFKLLQNQIVDISLHIVGSGPEEENLKAEVKKEQIQNVVFHGAIYDDTITGSMIYCSDLMIIPRWVGLSIVHSFCYECPVVTFESFFHPPEITYLEHGKTGYILGNQSDEEIVYTLKEYLLNSELQYIFRRNVLTIVNTKANMDKMVSGISAAIDYFL